MLLTIPQSLSRPLWKVLIPIFTLSVIPTSESQLTLMACSALLLTATDAILSSPWAPPVALLSRMGHLLCQSFNPCDSGHWPIPWQSPNVFLVCFNFHPVSTTRVLSSFYITSPWNGIIDHISPHFENTV